MQQNVTNPANTHMRDINVQPIFINLPLIV